MGRLDEDRYVVRVKHRDSRKGIGIPTHHWVEVEAEDGRRARDSAASKFKTGHAAITGHWNTSDPEQAKRLRIARGDEKWDPGLPSKVPALDDEGRQEAKSNRVRAHMKFLSSLRKKKVSEGVADQESRAVSIKRYNSSAKITSALRDELLRAVNGGDPGKVRDLRKKLAARTGIMYRQAQRIAEAVRTGRGDACR